MLLAKIELSIYSDETQITTKMRFDFEGEDRLAKEGDWTPSDPASKRLAEIYFDDVGGWWELMSFDGGNKAIVMREHERATGISILWTDMAHDLALLREVEKFPLVLDQWGPGLQMNEARVGFSWKVIAA